MFVIKSIILLLVTLLAVPVLFSVQTLAFDPTQPACDTGTSSTNSAVCKDAATQNGSTTNPAIEIIKTAANIVALAVGIAAVVMIILGGISYMSAGGNQQQVSSAQRRVLAGVIGLVIVATAWAVTTFVVNKFIN